MHEYDLTLKAILMRLAGSLLTRLTGLDVVRWHNAELPEVRARFADLLGETLAGILLHIELQSTHDPRMAHRMLEYALAIYRLFGRFPRQYVLYVGEAPLRMQSRIETPYLKFECTIIDIRDLDSEPLIQSPSLDDNILSILAGRRDAVGDVRRVLEKIAHAEPPRRAEALKELWVLGGLRSLGARIKEESVSMPILTDFAEHDYFGPMIKSSRAEGRVEGRVEGERSLILRQIGKRFGDPPAWVQQRIESSEIPELESIGLRLFDATSREDLFS